MRAAEGADELAADLAALLDPRLASPRVELRTPTALAQAVSRGRWQTAPHLEEIGRRLIELVGGRNRRLAVVAPPRHGKSELISHYLPAWFLMRFPNRRVILCSYGEELAVGWGRRVRDTLAEWGPKLAGIELRSDVSAADRFDIAGFAGGMTCVGAGGAITGRGADLLIVDDPIKNFEEAASAAARDRLWDWWRSVAITRLEPGGGVVVAMTRWHEDDLVGRLVAGQDADADEGVVQWRVLRLPAVAEDDDALARQPGEALWPKRYPAEELDARRRQMGTALFEAMYQGLPRPAEGSIFRREWFRYFTELPDAYDLGGKIVPTSTCRVFSTVDLAVSTKTVADFTVVATFALAPSGELLVLDIVRKRLEGPDHLGLLHQVYERHAPCEIFVERVGYQLALVQEARRSGLPIRELSPDRDKVSRALFAAARMEGGNIYLRQNASWLEDLEGELLAFPRGRFDDQVDVIAYAAAQCAKPKGRVTRIITFP